MAQYYYGWHHSPPDERDHTYTASPQVLSALPPRVDLLTPALPAPFEPTWNQGGIGSCGPNTAGADIVFSGIRQQKITSMLMPSRMFIYWCTRYLMGTVNEDSGVHNRAMMKALHQYGWCEEKNWPYVITKFQQKPTDACFAEAKERRITEYLAVPQTMEGMKGALASGDTFIFGFNVYTSMESDAVSRTGDVPMPTSRDRQVGGHDVLIYGYDDDTQRFKFRNSWGRGWGNNGNGTIPYEYAANAKLAGDFWTAKKSGLADPAPVPPAPPAPVTSKRTVVIVGASEITIDGVRV